MNPNLSLDWQHKKYNQTAILGPKNFLNPGFNKPCCIINLETNKFQSESDFESESSV